MTSVILFNPSYLYFWLESDEESMESTFEIQNLKCGGCEATILKYLKALDGIKNVHLDMGNSSVSFEHTHSSVLPEIERTLSTLGYPVVGDPNSLVKKAKSYVSCAIGRMNK